MDFKRFAKIFTFDLETSKVTAQPLPKSSVYLNYESGRAKGREYVLWMKIFQHVLIRSLPRTLFKVTAHPSTKSTLYEKYEPDETRKENI